METNVSVLFSNFSMPPNDFNGPMELSLEGKTYKFNYPLIEPLKITLSPKFINETITLTLLAINPKDKKTKAFCRGSSILQKVIFSDKKTRFEKIITMIPTDNKFKDVNMKKAGKILIEIELLDPYDEWLKNTKTLGKKSSLSRLSKISTTDKEKEGNKKQFDDNISDVSDEEEEKDEDKKDKINFEDINNFISKDYIMQLKKKLEEDYDKILPKDIKALKKYNKNLYDKYLELSNKYNEILSSLDDNNQKTKNKAIQYWNDYKKLKKDLYKSRLEFKKMKKSSSQDVSQSKKDIQNINKNMKKLIDEKEVFLNNLLGKDDTNNLVKISNGNENNDIKILTDLIKKFNSLGLKVSDELNISEEEKKILSVLTGINFEHSGNNGGLENEGTENNQRMKGEQVLLGNDIVNLIERDVNDLYARQIIKEVTINQINAVTYSFADDSKTSKVRFRIKENDLFCETGEPFTTWLINNFKLK